ncbi:MAG: hypothetical protein WDN06_02705 [Asticcacaulis sp.]
MAAPSTPNTKLEYDPEGRLSRYSRDNGVSWTSFVYDGTNLIAEYNGTTSTVLATYVFGPGTDEPLVWYQNSGFNNRHYLVSNYQGSIIATLDASFLLEHTYEYGPYGEPEIDKSKTGAWAATTPRFRYTGQTALYDAQLYYYKAVSTIPPMATSSRPIPSDQKTISICMPTPAAIRSTGLILRAPKKDKRMETETHLRKRSVKHLTGFKKMVSAPKKERLNPTRLQICLQHK